MITALLSLALAISGAADTNEQPPTETAEVAKKSKPKLICRRIADTGSRLAQRECRTQEDWDKQADAISRRMDEASRSQSATR